MADMFQGVVRRGLGQGRSLGFPTANLAIPSSVSLPEGIWAAWARLDNQESWRKAAAHIGPRPSIEGAAPTVELHLLNFPDQNLYGHTIQFVLQTQLREIKKFATIQALQAAIQSDCQQARALLTSPPASL